MKQSSTGRILSWSAAGMILYASYLLILLTLPYLSFEKNVEFLASKQLVYHLDWWRWSFYIHVFSSPVVILTGLFQFSHRMIHRHSAWHRRLGKVYIITVLLISGPAALVMSCYANGNWITKFSFILLSCCWIIFTYRGYRAARNRNFELHGNFLLKSYALTLSAVMLRFYAYLMDITGVSIHPQDAYLLIAWSSWIPNLLVAHYLIRKGFIRKRVQAVP